MKLPLTRDIVLKRVFGQAPGEERTTFIPLQPDDYQYSEEEPFLRDTFTVPGPTLDVLYEQFANSAYDAADPNQVVATHQWIDGIISSSDVLDAETIQALRQDLHEAAHRAFNAAHEYRAFLADWLRRFRAAVEATWQGYLSGELVDANVFDVQAARDSFTPLFEELERESERYNWSVDFFNFMVAIALWMHYGEFEDEHGYLPCEGNAEAYCEGLGGEKSLKEQEYEDEHCEDDEEAECVLWIIGGMPWAPQPEKDPAPVGGGIPEDELESEDQKEGSPPIPGEESPGAASDGPSPGQDSDQEGDAEQSKAPRDSESTPVEGPSTVSAPVQPKDSVPADSDGNPDVRGRYSLDSGPLNNAVAPKATVSAGQPPEELRDPAAATGVARPPGGEPGETTGTPSTAGSFAIHVRGPTTTATPPQSGRTVPHTSGDHSAVVMPPAVFGFFTGFRELASLCSSCKGALAYLKSGVTDQEAILDCLWAAADRTIDPRTGRSLTAGLDRASKDKVRLRTDLIFACSDLVTWQRLQATTSRGPVTPGPSPTEETTPTPSESGGFDDAERVSESRAGGRTCVTCSDALARLNAGVSTEEAIDCLWRAANTTVDPKTGQRLSDGLDRNQKDRADLAAKLSANCSLYHSRYGRSLRPEERQLPTARRAIVPPDSTAVPVNPDTFRSLVFGDGPTPSFPTELDCQRDLRLARQARARGELNSARLAIIPIATRILNIAKRLPPGQRVPIPMSEDFLPKSPWSNVNWQIAVVENYCGRRYLWRHVLERSEGVLNLYGRETRFKVDPSAVVRTSRSKGFCDVETESRGFWGIVGDMFADVVTGISAVTGFIGSWAISSEDAQRAAKSLLGYIQAVGVENLSYSEKLQLQARAALFAAAAAPGDFVLDLGKGVLLTPVMLLDLICRAFRGDRRAIADLTAMVLAGAATRAVVKRRRRSREGDGTTEHRSDNTGSQPDRVPDDSAAIDADALRTAIPEAAVAPQKRLRRPYIRVGVRKEVERRARKTADGRFLDPNTGMPIDGKYHLGHKYGDEFWRHRDRAEAQGLTQKEFNDLMNDPRMYQIEDPRSNMSHRFERPKDIE